MFYNRLNSPTNIGGFTKVQRVDEDVGTEDSFSSTLYSPRNSNPTSPSSARPLSARGSRPTSAVQRGSGFVNGLGETAPTSPSKFYTDTLMSQQKTAFQTSVEMLKDEDDIPEIPTRTIRHNDSGTAAEYNSFAVKNPTPKSSVPSTPIPQKSLYIGDRRVFVSKPAPKEYGMIRCCITRDTSGLNKIFPRYYLWHEEANKAQTFLMSAKKRKKNRTSNYTMSLAQDDMKKDSGSFHGKVRANFLGTEFSIFDKGDNPTSKNVDSKARHMLGAVMYEANLIGSKGPRKITVLVPDVDANDQPLEFPQVTDKHPLIEKYKEGNWQKMKVLKNKNPVYSESAKAYVLNFEGRCAQASVKNFQLVEPENQNLIYIQMGKIDNNKFTLDFRFPVSAMQAFAVALSSFDSKIACE
jgi:tubby-related protein 1